MNVEYDEDYYKELCQQIDYFGEESLTEEQQYLYHLWNRNLGECNK